MLARHAASRLRITRWLLPLLLMLAAASTTTSVTFAAGVLDQQQTQAPNWYLNGLLRWAQVVMPGQSGVFSQVDLLGGCPSGCSGPLVISLYSVSRGIPQAPLASMTVSLTDLQYPTGSTGEWRSFVFPSPAYVTQGTPVAVLVDGSGSTGTFQLDARDGDPYPAGQLLSFNSSLHTWQPATSSAGPQDLTFRTYVTNAPAPPPNPTPTVTAISPSSVSAGGPSLTLTVSGSGFVNSSLVNWNGTLCDGFSGAAPCSTTVVSGTQLTVSIPAAAVSAPMCAAVSVLSPGPGGGVSSPQPFAVTPSLPAGALMVTAADCTATTDSTAAFVSALQTAAAQHATLVVPPGRYLVKPDSLTVHGGVTISGQGATLISSGPGYILLDLSGSNIDVEGLTVDGASQVLHVVEVERSSTNLTLHWVTVQNAGQDPNSASPNHSAPTVGIRVQGDGHTMLFDTITVQNVVAQYSATYSDGPSIVARGLYLDTYGAQTVSKQVTVRNSSFTNVAPKDDGDCLVIQGSSDVDAGLVITGNRFDRCYKRAIKLQVGGVVVQNNTINNPFHGDNLYIVRTNTFDDVTKLPTFDMFAAIALHSANMLVSGNTTTGTGSYYQTIELTQASGAPSLQNLTIVGNTLANGAGSVTSAPSSFVRSDVPIANLAIRSNSMTNAPWGLWFDKSVTNAAISCNTYTGVAARSESSIGAEQPCQAPPPPPIPPKQSVAIPSYFAPGAMWSQLDAAAPVVAMAIINPNNGPGAAISFDYVNQVQQARAQGITVLGYVSTAYGNRPASSIKLDIDAYYSWYGVDGIFFDQASSNCTLANFYAGLRTYTTSKNASARTVLKSGASAPECYVNTADVLVTFEGDANTYLNSYSGPAWAANYAPSHFWHLVYAATTDQQMQSVVALSKTRGAGWIYVTPNSLPNPWSPLPTDPYWSDELTAASHAAAPGLTSVSPSSAQVQPATGAGQSVTISGTNFGSGSIVNWRPSSASSAIALPTAFVSPTQLTATIPAADLSAPGFAELTVIDSTTGVTATGTLPFFVTATSTTVTNVVSATNTTPNTTFTVASAPLGTVGSVGVSATGSGSITVAQYSANPQTIAPSGGATMFFDVHVASGSNLSALQIVDCDLTGTPSDPAYGILQWWTGSTWSVVSNQTPNSPQAGCTTATLSGTSTPSVTQLVGSPFAVVVDATPPTTTATLSGTPGKNGWYVSPVQVSLSATDNVGGSGVASTVYSLDGAASQPYTGAIAVSSDGQHTLAFHSTDVAGNVESAHTRAIAVDQTPPTVTYSGNQGTYGVLDKVTITCTATDPAPGSGLASTTCATVSGPAYTFSASSPNTFTATASDVAGNTASATTSFTLKVTASDLCTLTKQFIESSPKYVASQSNDRAKEDAIATGLCQRLNNIALANLNDKAQLVTAYESGVRGLQEGGWVTAAQATILSTLVKAL